MPETKIFSVQALIETVLFFKRDGAAGATECNGSVKRTKTT
jgi:hypothetical protein